MNVGGAKSSFNFKVKNQTVGDIRKKSSSGLKQVFPMLKKEVLAEAMKHNDALTLLLDPNASLEGASIGGVKVKADMSQAISIEFVARGNASFDAIVTIVGEETPSGAGIIQNRTTEDLQNMITSKEKSIPQQKKMVNSLQKKLQTARETKAKEKQELVDLGYEGEELNEALNAVLDANDQEGKVEQLEDQLKALKSGIQKSEKAVELAKRELQLRDEEAVSIDLSNPQDDVNLGLDEEGAGETMDFEGKTLTKDNEGYFELNLDD